MFIREFYYTSKDGRKRIKWEYKCDICGDKGTSDKYNLCKSISHKCKGCNNKIEGKKKRGKSTSKKGKSFLSLQRENSACWNGGRYVNSGGYVMVLVKSGSTHRNSGWDNYRPEHIVVMEKSLGRKLNKNECVHHIDGNRRNNMVGNLALITSNEHHRKTHMSLQKIGYELYKQGKISFNRKTKEYEVEVI